MATRFIHSVLAWQSAQNNDCSEQERRELLMGSLLPDAIERRKKKETHFNPYPGCLWRNNNQMSQKLRTATVWTRQGWLLHLDLDDLWQTTCVRPRLFLAPYFLLRYGISISQRYYRELSYFDVLFRSQLSTLEIDQLRQDLGVLSGAELREWPNISVVEWRGLIEKIQWDLSKESPFQGPWMIGEDRFWSFLNKARRRLDEGIIAIKDEEDGR